MPIDNISGFINVNKGLNWTSAQAVGFVKKTLELKKVGHCGALDPLATGVLPLCVGKATRLSDIVMSSEKQYTLRVRFGVATATDDAEGEAVVNKPYAHISRAAVEAALREMRGELAQTPPIYSAIKHKGVRLYKLARANVKVDLQPRQVSVKQVELLNFEPPFADIRLTCGKGFYARSYARDLGIKLESAAHLAGLKRNRVGRFKLEDALAIEDLANLAKDGVKSILAPPDCVLSQFPKLELDARQRRLIRNGAKLDIDLFQLDAESRAQTRFRAYDADGELVALLKRADDDDNGDRLVLHTLFN